jgi:alkylation response protein AidB-like acyl-CoA dehydrogenase
MTDDTLSMLADASAAFAAYDARRVRALRGSENGFDRERWKAIAGQGWLSVLVPEARGGLGLGAAAVNVIARRLGYALYPEPFVGCGVMAGSCLAAAPVGEANDARLAKFGAGETVVALAWQDAAGAIEPANPPVQANRDARGASLRGAVRFVCAPADAYLVAAKGDGGVGLYWVAAEARGLRQQREERADGGVSVRLELDGVAVAAADLVAPPEDGARILRAALDTGLVAAGAELVGLAERMLEMTLEYLRTRQQFGKPIGSFQALQHRAVDLWVQGELAKAAVTAAERVLDDPQATPPQRAAAASGAKARTSDAALTIGKQAIQLHGAIGMTDEYDLGLYFNRVLALSAWLGNAAEHRRRYRTMKEAA